MLAVASQRTNSWGSAGAVAGEKRHGGIGVGRLVDRGHARSSASAAGCCAKSTPRVQVRSGDEELAEAADDPETRRRVEAERAVVFAIGGGCLAPVAAHHDGRVLRALVAAEDGSWVEQREGDDPAALAAELAAVAEK